MPSLLIAAAALACRARRPPRPRPEPRSGPKPMARWRDSADAGGQAQGDDDHHSGLGPDRPRRQQPDRDQGGALSQACRGAGRRGAWRPCGSTSAACSAARAPAIPTRRPLPIMTAMSARGSRPRVAGPGQKCVWVAGHSEGGLVAMRAANGPNVCGVVLLAAPGERLGDTIRKQLRANPANAPVLASAEKALGELEAGRKVPVDGPASGAGARVVQSRGAGVHDRAAGAGPGQAGGGGQATDAGHSGRARRAGRDRPMATC